MGVDVERIALTNLPPGSEPDTYHTTGWVGPMSGIDGCVNSSSQRDSIQGPFSQLNVKMLVISVRTQLYDLQVFLFCH
jgi:hypothetical protein